MKVAEGPQNTLFPLFSAVASQQTCVEVKLFHFLPLCCEIGHLGSYFPLSAKGASVDIFRDYCLTETPATIYTTVFGAFPGR